MLYSDYPLKAVRVEGAPGYGDFDAVLYDTFGGFDDRGTLGILIDYQDNILIIPMRHVREL